MESEFDTLNSVIISSPDNCCLQLQQKNKTDETLMNKGFQGYNKKYTSEKRSFNRFDL
jgi:hypothetical protein